MFKPIIRFLIFLAVLCGIGYWASHALLNLLSYKAMNYTISRLQSPNLRLSEPSFKRAKISSFDTVAWEDFTIIAVVGPNNVISTAMKATIFVKELTVEATEFFKGNYLVSLKGLRISAGYFLRDASSEEEDAPEVLQEGNLTVPLKLSIASFAEAKAQIRKYAYEVKRLTEDGKTILPIKFAAEEILTIKGATFTVSLRIDKKENMYHLVANRDDLQLIAETIIPRNQSTTAADIEIIANNPLRAPRLLKMRSRATDEASAAHERNSSVPEKAYRHVLWSYLLTRQYGADFAKEVTDAHECEADPEEKSNPNVAAEHRQDFQNNEVGRTYAGLGYGESKILDLVRTDPNVVR